MSAPLYIVGSARWPLTSSHLERGGHEARDPEPSARWLPPRMSRGSSRLTRMLASVAAAAVESARRDPSSVATVYASSLGELETMLALVGSALQGDGIVSPLRFKSSVHNTASGLAAIGMGNTAFSTAIAGGARTVEAGLLEALALVSAGVPDVAVAVADDAIPVPFDGAASHAPLAIGLVISSSPCGALCRIDGVERLLHEVEAPAEIRPGHGERRNPTADALPLLRALAAREPGVVPLAFDAARPFALRLGALP